MQSSVSSHVTPNTIQNIWAPSIRIKVWIINNGRPIDAFAILDSGAEGVYCNKAFIEKHKIPTHPLETPVYTQNVDGTMNKQGIIHHAAILWMEMGTRHKEYIKMAITNTSNHDILLGTDWLKAHNPSIDWTRNKLILNWCTNSYFSTSQSSSDPTLGHLLPTIEWEDQYDDFIESKYQGIDASECIMAHLQSYFKPIVARTTVSTTLAKEIVKTPFEGIPPAFCKSKKVFSDEEAQRLPKHQPWDHKIDLVPGQQIGKTSVYWLMPPEKLALKDYIEDGLKWGTLWQSEAPNACSFFFIDKKDGKLHPVQDYHPLNAITRKNVAPIPLIPELINKLLGARFFTKLDVRWGYNNIRI